MRERPVRVSGLASRSWLKASPIELPRPRPRLRVSILSILVSGGSFPREDSPLQEDERRSRAATQSGWRASAGRANRKPFRRPHARNEFADPVTARRFDMPGHCLGRIGGRIGNVLADLLAVEPAAAVRVARLADEMDVAVVLQQHVASGRKKCTGKLDRTRQLAHQQERAGGLRFRFGNQYADQAVDRRDYLRCNQGERLRDRAGRRDRKIFALW